MSRKRALSIAGVVLAFALAALAREPARAGEAANFYEGTWTPTIAGVSTAGTASYTVQIGRYARYGNRVIATAILTYTTGTGTGQGSIAGLPFAARSVTSSDAFCNVAASNYTFGAVQLAAGITASESVIKLYGLASAAAISTIAYDAAASLWVTCVYEVTP